MAKYIEKEKVINELRYNNKVTHYSDDKCEDIVYKTTREMQQLVFEMPAADVQPVIHAKWEMCSDGYPYCSNCGTEPDNGTMSNFCPMCGADMREHEPIKG